MKASELRAMQRSDLEKKCIELRKELFVLAMRRARGDEIKTHLFSMARKDLARIKTILREQEQAGTVS